MLRLSNNSLPSLEHTFLYVLEGDEVTFHHLTPGKGQHKKKGVKTAPLNLLITTCLVLWVVEVHSLALAPLFKSVFVSFTYNDIVNVFLTKEREK